MSNNIEGISCFTFGRFNDPFKWNTLYTKFLLQKLPTNSRLGEFEHEIETWFQMKFIPFIMEALYVINDDITWNAFESKNSGEIEYN